MHGNVWEWCEDWYADDLGKDDVKDPKGPAEGKGKVFKGGGYVFSARDCRSAARLVLQYAYSGSLFLASGLPCLKKPDGKIIEKIKALDKSRAFL